jgi:hypothetical protein
MRLVLNLFLTADLNEKSFLDMNFPSYRLGESHKILRRLVEPPYEASPPYQQRFLEIADLTNSSIPYDC